MWIQDEDLRRRGFYVVRASGLDDGLPVVPPTQQVGGLTRVSGTLGTVSPRSVTLELACRHTDAATLEAAGHWLRGLVLAGPLRLRHRHRVGQTLTARCVGLTITPTAPQYVAPYLWRATLALVADVPWWEADAWTERAFTDMPVPLPCGTAASSFILTITAGAGTVTDPVVRLYRASGQEVGVLAPVVTLTFGNLWRYDGRRGIVERCDSGVWSDARSTLPLSTVPLVLRPQDADRALGAWASIAVSAGHGHVTYREMYQ